MMPRGRVETIVYYGALAVLLALIVTRALPHLLPGSLADQLSRNSEGLLVLLMVSVWISFVRSRLNTAMAAAVMTSLAAFAWVAIGLVLRYGPVPRQLVPLNESALALAVLLPYLQLRRPLPLWGWIVPLAAVAIPLIGGSNEITTDLAEAFGALVLIPLCLDIVDRGILDGSAVPLLRVLAWMATLFVVVALLHTFIDRTPEGLLDEITRYVSRVTEMFIASMLLHLYFSLLRPELRSQQLRSFDSSRSLSSSDL